MFSQLYAFAALVLLSGVANAGPVVNSRSAGGAVVAVCGRGHVAIASELSVVAGSLIQIGEAVIFNDRDRRLDSKHFGSGDLRATCDAYDQGLNVECLQPKANAQAVPFAILDRQSQPIATNCTPSPRDLSSQQSENLGAQILHCCSA